MPIPKLSIITVNFNNGEGLRRTIESVARIKSPEIEYIIIDGGSTDKSKEYILSNSGKIDYWVSEKDNGIYHAMNKGILSAHGEYCLFLNSGDCIKHGRSPIEELERKSPLPSLLTFVKPQDRRKWKFKEGTNPRISFGYVFLHSLWHSNTFISRSILNELGGYSESYKIVSDWEFFMKALFLNGCSIGFFDEAISENEPDGISASNLDLHMKERIDVMEKLFPHHQVDINEILRYRRSRIVNIYDKFLKSKFLTKTYNLFFK